MLRSLPKSTVLFLFIALIACGNVNSEQKTAENLSEDNPQKKENNEIATGADQTEKYLPLLKGKKIGIVGNQTSLIKSKSGSYVHLVDSLKNMDVNIIKVFAPEHGFRGTADAGEKIKDGIDTKTGLPVVSLYGNNKKPSAAQLKDLDLMVFDIQDVGARFYTYISTLHYIMEACAENDISLLILDRPNPNGHYIDGPILETENQSFVGMHPVPVVHGMTIGEYAKMINGEGWLKNGMQCMLNIIPVQNYDHSKAYSLPVKPSPNLPNDQSINLYPSLCFFEGTNVNAGRGTNKQFQVFGSPFLDAEFYNFQYTPESMDGATNPKHLGKECYGIDLSNEPKLSALNLNWLINAYNLTNESKEFFNAFFTKLAGTKQLQQQIEAKASPEEIYASWKPGLEKYQETRKKYLIYN